MKIEVGPDNLGRKQGFHFGRGKSATWTQFYQKGFLTDWVQVSLVTDSWADLVPLPFSFLLINQSYNLFAQK